MKMPDQLNVNMLAPCGVNCSLCMAHLREKKQCPGCNSSAQEQKPFHCTKCSIKYCEKRLENHYDFCGACQKKCRRMKQLDARYRQNYDVSLLEVLAVVREHGAEALLQREKSRWTCLHCGGVVCMHKGTCSECGKTK